MVEAIFFAFFWQAILLTSKYSLVVLLTEVLRYCISTKMVVKSKTHLLWKELPSPILLLLFLSNHQWIQDLNEALNFGWPFCIERRAVWVNLLCLEVYP